MLKSWDEVAKYAVAQKLVKEAPAFTTTDTGATEQAAQIQNLIVQSYDAIVDNRTQRHGQAGLRRRHRGRVLRSRRQRAVRLPRRHRREGQRCRAVRLPEQATRRQG